MPWLGWEKVTPFWFIASKWHLRCTSGRAPFLLILVALVLDSSVSNTPRSGQGLGARVPHKALQKGSFHSHGHPRSPGGSPTTWEWQSPQTTPVTGDVKQGRALGESNFPFLFSLQPFSLAEWVTCSMNHWSWKRVTSTFPWKSRKSSGLESDPTWTVWCLQVT